MILVILWNLACPGGVRRTLHLLLLFHFPQHQIYLNFEESIVLVFFDDRIQTSHLDIIGKVSRVDIAKFLSFALSKTGRSGM